MTSRKQVQAVFFSVIMVVSMLAMGAGGVAAQSPASDDPAIESDLDGLDVTGESIDDETTPVSDAESGFELEQEGTQTAPQLEEASGETVLLLSVDRNLDRGDYFTADTNTLQADSEATLQPVAEDVEQLGAEVREQFWLGNIVSVNADLDTHDVEDFASIDGVQAVAANAEATHPTPPEVNPAASVDQDGDVTYGLDQIDVLGFEEEFGVSGDNATVSIIDDGISNPDEGHPDLEFATEAIAANGEVTTGTLGAPGAHGEHVAGTATGAADPEGDVPRYGVAPDADLIKINAFEGGAFTDDIIAAVQYSHEEGADVASMSLGFGPVDGTSTIQPMMDDVIQDANAAGTMVIGSAGNEGSGDVGGPATSPGAEFDGFSVGASNDAGNIAGFSSGALINEHQIAITDGGEYPDTYPHEFVKPDVAAPGADVLSAGPLGEPGALYSVASGTSMAAPHVAGSVALVQSATGDEIHPKVIESALVETAEKEDNEFTERNNRDIRFGAGIINVTAATQAVQDGTIEVDGTVTDSEGEPIAGATVATDDGALTTTDTDGNYTLQTTADSADVTADEFGFAAETNTVDDNAELDFQLEDELDVRLFEDQPVLEEIGSSFTVSADVANLENLTVELTEETDVAAEDVTITLAGEEVLLGDSVEPPEATGVVELTIEVDDADEGDIIGLEHTFEGPGDPITATTGPTELVDELEPPEFELSNFVSTTDSQPVGEPVDYAVQVDVTNVGQETGMVELAWFNGPFSLAGNNPIIELEPGETATETLDFGEVVLYDEPQTVSHGFDAIDVETDTVEDTVERPFVAGESVAVGVVDDRSNQVRGDAVADTLADELPTFFDVEVIASDEFDEQDVVVVQNLASNDPAGLLDETEAFDVGVVYLDQWGSHSNAIPRRAALTDDPDATFRDDDSAGGPVSYEIGADHPIFADVGDAGDTVEIANSAFADHTWFEGTDTDVLAQVEQGGEVAGDAFAVDEDANVVLASSLGYTQYVGDDEYTADADAILANAVQHTVPEDRATITVDDEFAGVVADDEEISVTIEDSDAGDFEPGDRITVTVDGEPVTVTEVDDDVVMTTFDPTTLDIPAGETVEVDIEEFDDTVTDTVDIVDEAIALDEGFNAHSVPQGADLTFSSNIADAFVWDSSEQTYEGVSEATFDSADELNDGLYLAADNDDARLGYTFLDEVPAPSSADIESGWNLVGSNFDVSSQQSQPLTDDLRNVYHSGLTVVDGGQEEMLSGGDAINEFDAYWAFVEEDDVRPIITPAYDRGDREAVLGVDGAGNFEVSIADIELSSVDEADGDFQSEDRNVVGSSEQLLTVEAFVENTGDQSDVQFADLEVTRIEPTVEFERVDRTGVELEPGDAELVELTYVASQDDTPNQIPFPLPDDLAIQVLTDDDTASSGVAFDGGGITVEDQALTSDDEFIVDNVDFAGEGIVALLADDGSVLDSQGVDTINDEVRFNDFDPADVTDTVEVVIVDPDTDEILTGETASVLDTRIEVTNNAPSFALVNETVEIPATVTNNARDTETDEITFEVIDINGEEIEFNTSQDVTLDPGFNTVTFDADTEALGTGVGDEITHAVSSSDDTSERVLTIAEATLEFNDQSVGTTSDGEPAVLVEDVTADTDQQIVITDASEDLEVVGSVDVDERINDADVAVPLDTVAPGDHIAHVVADDTDVPEEGPGLVNDVATITAADVTIDPIDDITVESAEVPTDVVETVTVDTTVLDVVGDRNEDYTVEIRDGTDVIGESGNLTDTADDVTIELDDPVTAEEDAFVTLDAVIVDQNDEEFRATAGGSFPSFDTVQDSTTFEIEVVPSDSNVELPDQALGASDGADAVFADAVTGSAGQFVAITAADELDEILGATELDEDVAGEEIIVELDEEIDAGEYRVHLTSDVGLIGDDDEIITDDGTIFDAELTFEDQNITGSADEVTAATADLLDGMDDDTEFVIDLHPTDEDDVIIGDEAIGQSDTLTGANEDVTIELDEEITESDDFVAMFHFGPSDEPLSTPPITQVADDAVVPVIDQATVTIDDPAAVFEVSDLEPEEATVTEGEEFDVSATIENTGEEAGEQEVELRLEPDGDAVASQNVTLSEGDDESVTFEDVSVDEPGEYNHTIASDDDQATGSLTVEATAFFEVSDLEPEEATVVEGEEFNVSAMITNTGDLEGTQDIELRLSEDGDAVATQSVTLAGGDDATVTFEDVSVNEPGEYDHTVASEDEVAVGSLTVLSSESNFVVSNLEPEDAQVEEGADPIDVSADVENLGTVGDTQDIGLDITDDAGDTVFDETQELTLSDGEEATVTFEDVPAGTLDIGDYTHEVSSENDSVAGSLSVVEEVDDPELVAVLPDETAAVGDEVTADLAVDVPDSQPDQQVGSFVVDITYDDTVVTFEDATSEEFDLTVNPGDSGEFLVLGTELDGVETPIPETISIEFEVIGEGEADLEFDEAASQFTNQNSVELITQYEAGSIVGEDPDGPSFAVDNLDPATAEVPEDGDPINVSADLENVGNEAGTQSVALEVLDDSDEVVFSEMTDVTLDPNESETVTFEDVPAGTLAPGDYTHQVVSEDDAAAGDLTVVANEANFDVSDLDPASAEVPEGADPIDVSATVDNIGNADGVQDVELTVEDSAGEIVFDATQEVSLDAGENTTVTFEDVPAGTLEPGEYTHQVASEDAAATGDLTVLDVDEDDLVVSLSDEEADVGETVAFDLEAAGIDGEETVATYDFTIEFDDSVLDFTNADGVDFVDPVANATNGTLAMNAFDLPGSDTPLTLATLEFEVLDDGTADLTFDTAESEVIDDDLNEYDVEYSDGGFSPTGASTAALNTAVASA